MKKKVLLPLATAFSILTAVPMTTFASSRLDQINKDLKATKAEKNTTINDVQNIDNTIKTTEQLLKNLETEIPAIQAQSLQASKELDGAMARVKARDGIMKKRVTAMYEAGDISYFDVLLGAKDFGDFIDRLEAVKMIVTQDSQILEDNKKDKDLIEAKKKEIDTNLSNLKVKQEQSQILTKTLASQKQVKEARIKELTLKEGSLNEAKAEEEQAALSLASRSASRYTGSVTYSGGVFIWPTNGRITSPFGYRSDPFTGERYYHDGIDIGAPQGTPIVSAAEGVVSFVGQINGYGNVVMVYHGNGLTTFYAHIRNGGICVSNGQSVGKGTKIAEVGSTGRSTGPHLHFSVILNGTKVDPMSYLR